MRLRKGGKLHGTEAGYELEPMTLWWRSRIYLATKKKLRRPKFQLVFLLFGVGGAAGDRPCRLLAESIVVQGHCGRPAPQVAATAPPPTDCTGDRNGQQQVGSEVYKKNPFPAAGQHTPRPSAHPEGTYSHLRTPATVGGMLYLSRLAGRLAPVSA